MISFAPYGRGSTPTISLTESPYTTIALLLNTPALTGAYLADNAGLSENFFDMTTDESHKHQDGSLGAGVIGNSNIDFTSAGDPEGVSNPLDVPSKTQFCVTHTPKSLIVFGLSYTFDITANNEEYYVPFGYGKDDPPEFMEGTKPIVLLSVARHNSSGNARPPFGVSAVTLLRVDLVFVTNKGFTFRVESTVPTPPSDKTARVYYMAYGVAPGYLTDPAGVV